MAVDEELKARLIKLETRYEEADKLRERMASQLDELVADLHQRRGKDAFARVGHREEREDAWQRNAWVRAFLPTGIFTGIWIWVLDIIRDVWSGQ